jgi:hypothetical protein
MVTEPNFMSPGGHMPTEYRAAPKRGDRVRMGEKPSLFEVIAVNTLMRTASVKSTDGKDQVIRHISWASLRFQSEVSEKRDSDN